MDEQKWEDVFSIAVTARMCRGAPLSGSEHLTIWHVGSESTLSISDYVRRLTAQLRLDEEVLVVAYLFILRFLANHENSLTSSTVHKVVLSAVILADKWHQDKQLSMRQYGRVGGVAPREAARLESHFWKAIQFRVHVSGAAYRRGREAMLRRWRISETSSVSPFLFAPVVGTRYDQGGRSSCGLAGASDADRGGIGGGEGSWNKARRTRRSERRSQRLRLSSTNVVSL